MIAIKSLAQFRAAAVIIMAESIAARTSSW